MIGNSYLVVQQIIKRFRRLAASYGNMKNLVAILNR